MGRIRVLVVDDHRIFAESLAAALAAEPDVEVSAAGSEAAAHRCLERAAADGRRYNVLLVDADLGAGSQPTPQRVPDLRGPDHPTAPATPVGGLRDPLARGLVRRDVAARDGIGAARGPVARDGMRPAQARDGLTRDNGAPPVPSGDGLGLVEKVRLDHPGTRAVVLADRDDPRRAARALQAGASGWVAKDCSLSRLLAVVRGVLRDETHLPPALLTGVLRELTAARRHRTESERLVESLTPREQEVLRCMVAGLGRKAVAERLYLSPHTVRTHMQNVLGKLGVHSTLAAVALARRAGVGPVDTVPAARHGG
ncbi:two-component system response regulator [Wenjunlia vitaminophila]|uniref:Two-component system response regulator n=1 Tax=Wenjunlia vitaminophila TaxID=76728 RepID=A0A0T6LS13_WENVI|nr:response regulator transcription factor [Wenjunlia vitaminophila]KRV48848.1 two-component system response regulator [Wenjunlia vitaminophila]